MTVEELKNLYLTMPFAKDPVKEVLLVDENTIYLVSFNGPDLIFRFKSMYEWSLQTVRELIVEKKGRVHDDRYN